MPKTNLPLIRIHNVETNEIIDREMTAEEFVVIEAQQAIKAAEQAEAEARATARQAILDRLGLTADEAKLILG